MLEMENFKAKTHKQLGGCSLHDSEQMGTKNIKTQIAMQTTINVLQKMTKNIE